MAEVTGLRNNATPFPVYGLPWGIVIPLLDADGDLVTGATTPDSEVSKNGDTFADCTNEMTEIATNSGMYYLLLTGAEMTADVVTVICKSATAGMKTTPIVLYPRKLVAIRAGTAADDGSGTSDIVLDSGASAVDDFYNGMICAAVIDSTTEVRMIADYTGSTKAAAVTPGWNTAPDADDTFTIYRVEGAQIQQTNVSHWNSLATVALPLIPTTAGRTLDVSAGGEAGIDWANVGSPTTTVGLSGTTVKTATDVETDTADIQTRLPASLVSGRIDASVGAMAANVMTAAAAAADLTTELQSGLATQASVDIIDDFLDTEIAAIKAKTDNLPASPAAVGSAMALTSGERNSVADALLDRDMSTGTDSGSTTVRTVRQALRFLRNKWSITTGTLTVTKEDDSTASWTAAVTTDAAADPIISNDPAGP